MVGRKRLKREKWILDDDQLRDLLVELPPEIGLMVRTAVSTGMRVSEIIGLKWRAVDLSMGSCTFSSAITMAILTSRRPTSRSGLFRWVTWRRSFASCGRRLKRSGKSSAGTNTCFTKRMAAERLGPYFEGFGWHSLRRQNITLMQTEGATTFEAMEQAGHTRSTMTSHFRVVALTRREQAVRRAQERLFGSHPPKLCGVVRDKIRVYLVGPPGFEPGTSCTQPDDFVPRVARRRVLSMVYTDSGRLLPLTAVGRRIIFWHSFWHTPSAYAFRAWAPPSALGRTYPPVLSKTDPRNLD